MGLMNHSDGREILLEIHNLLRGIGMNHFLICGTALGAYRDRGFCQLEKDIDIGFRWNCWHAQVGQLVSELVYHGYEIQTVSQPFTQCRIVKATKKGIKVDLVAFLPYGDKWFCPNTDPALSYSIVYPKSVFENLETIELFGCTFLIPSPPEQYLENEYGADWRTPKDDSVSRTRIRDFVEQERIAYDYLEPKSV